MGELRRGPATGPSSILLIALTLALGPGCSNGVDEGEGEQGVGPAPSPGPLKTLVVQGVFAPDGKRLLGLHPVRLSHIRVDPPEDVPGGHFAVHVEFADGRRRTVRFDAWIADGPGGPVHGVFEILLPVRGGIQRVRITDSADSMEFAAVEAAEIGGQP